MIAYKKYLQKASWDSRFFKRNIYRTVSNRIDTGLFTAITSGATMKMIDLIYHFQDIRWNNDIYLLEENRFHLVEQKVDLVMNLKEADFAGFDPCPNIVNFDVKIHDMERLYQIARQISKYSRFMNDRNFESSQIEELYRLWVYNSFYKGFGDKIFIYIADHEIYGFCITQITGEGSVRISLIGIDELFTGKSIGSKILREVCRFYSGQGYLRFYVGTQMRNKDALNFYIKNKFHHDKLELIYHKWLHI